jgi:hypothetical protein
VQIHQRDSLAALRCLDTARAGQERVAGWRKCRPGGYRLGSTSPGCDGRPLPTVAATRPPSSWSGAATGHRALCLAAAAGPAETAASRPAGDWKEPTQWKLAGSAMQQAMQRAMQLISPPATRHVSDFRVPCTEQGGMHAHAAAGSRRGLDARRGHDGYLALRCSCDGGPRCHGRLQLRA